MARVGKAEILGRAGQGVGIGAAQTGSSDVDVPAEAGGAEGGVVGGAGHAGRLALGHLPVDNRIARFGHCI